MAEPTTQAAPVISRLVLTDDDGTGLTGTPLNNALFQDLQNRIDSLSNAIVAMIPALPAGIITTALLPGQLHALAAARTITLNDYPSGNISIDCSAYDCMVINNQNHAMDFSAPVWTGANGITVRDEASLIYRVRDAGVAQPITWSKYSTWAVPMQGIPLPTATVPLHTLHVGFRWSSLGYWFCVAIATD